MSKELIAALIGGSFALLGITINQVLEHIRWKENLKRKGEDAYLEKKLESLHDTIVKLEELTLKLSDLRFSIELYNSYDEEELLESLESSRQFFNQTVNMVAPYIPANRYKLIGEVRRHFKAMNNHYIGHNDIDTILDNLKELLILTEKVNIILKDEITKYEQHFKQTNWKFIVVSFLFLINLIYTFFYLFRS
ncbi:hypothetical protein [Peribacillus sp. ACCC06369]|uniref:hypothetical protein n=1 Tax=Peribacillus sp. ACCC06369 TaxID=3055860 RepID=UPI0025A1B215|nr:hypothetical protein [Peribacillus sp. ACCC06369]MDM5361178.1 hypothetical protein [Peribacillus sp. ACCC06369]